MLRIFKIIRRRIIHLFSVFYNMIVLSRYKIKLGKILKIKGCIYVDGGGQLRIGDNLKANSGSIFNVIGGDTRLSIVIKDGAQLDIGDNCGISNSTIVCHEKVTIGSNVLIGGSVKIYDTDFHSLAPLDRQNWKLDRKNAKTKPISIKNNVFIGAHSVILKGSCIGECSVVGAGSVVSGSIPAYEVWAGNPARFIKKVTNV